MAAPASKTIGDLNGRWVMPSPSKFFRHAHNNLQAPSQAPRRNQSLTHPRQNKTLSDNPEPGLALQGIGYLTRKAIGFATVTLDVRQYEQDGKPHVDIEQTATGGLKGTSEHRTVDGEAREHADWLFGKVRARSFFVRHEDLPAKIREVLGGDEFLAGDWIVADGERTGPGGALHLANYVEAEAGWTAAQVWGFQNIGGERRYARNVVIRKGDKSVELRLVYDFVES